MLSRLTLASALIAASVGGLLVLGPAAAGSNASKVPAAVQSDRGSGKRAVAVLAGGCFWGVEGVYEHVKGVREVTSGYAGGSARTAQYEQVSGGDTGHAEAVRIVYDPSVVRYTDLLRIFFSVVADPTQVNRQGPDSGPQYRTALFPQSPEQAQVAKTYLAQLGRSGTFKRPIATRIEAGTFTPAEAHHQDFMRLNPMHPYILAHDRPKVAALKRLFPDRWRA